MEMNRRHFLSTPALIAGMVQLEMTRLNADAPLARRFFMDLSCGRIGVKATFLESIDLAVRHGFEGVDPDAKYFGQLSGQQLDDTLAQMKAKGLRFGPASLPVDFRKDDTTFYEGLKALPETCKALQRAGFGE